MKNGNLQVEYNAQEITPLCDTIILKMYFKLLVFNPQVILSGNK